MKITLVGLGRLGRAVARGLADPRPEAHELTLVQRPGQTFERCRQAGLDVISELPEGHAPDVILVAVKPADLRAALRGIVDAVAAPTPIVSLASGVALASLRAALPLRFRPYRARTSIASSAGRACVFFAREARSDEEEWARVQAVLACLGRVYEVREEDMVRLTWYGSSLPLVMLSQVLLHGLEACPGEIKEAAASALVEGIHAVGQLLEQRLEGREGSVAVEEALASLYEDVVTPGGMNDAAFSSLRQAGFWEEIEAARNIYLSKEGSAPRHG